MEKFSSFKGSIELISGITQSNKGDFPLVDSHDVQIGEDGKRLSSMVQEFLDLMNVSISINELDESLDMKSNASMYLNDSLMLFNVYNKEEVEKCLK